jgi:hypothetical protein
MNHIINAPVLLIGFNRPDLIKKAFANIRSVKPGKLYIAIDGPRDSKPEDVTLCKEVIAITKNVDWKCEVRYLIREKNLGCKLGVSSAISWALKDEDRIIVIEDDIVVAPAFFAFADELLEKYKNDDRIAMISANQYTPIEIEQDYLFTKYGHIWGWATWRRVWDNFNVELPSLKNDIEKGLLKNIGYTKKEQLYIEKFAYRLLNLINHKTINTWDYQFAYHRIRNKLFSIAPRVNLASNIGTYSSRTDTESKENENYYTRENLFILSKHPQKIELSFDYDKYHFKNHINRRPSLVKRAFMKAIRILKIK